MVYVALLVLLVVIPLFTLHMQDKPDINSYLCKTCCLGDKVDSPQGILFKVVMI